MKISAFGIRGKRNTMEDVWDYYSDTNDTRALIAVFDGHGGDKSARAANDILLKQLWDDFRSDSYSSQIIRARHLEFDDFLLRHDVADGTTSTICWIWKKKNDHMLRCANLGDSEGFIFTKNGYRKITTNHDYENMAERQRVTDAGGFWSGSGHPLDKDMRVDGLLNISRALGDFTFKRPDHKVIASPSVQEIILRIDYKWVVIASDGLWNGMSPADVLEILNDNTIINKEKHLVHQAYENGSTDNICCICVCLLC